MISNGCLWTTHRYLIYIQMSDFFSILDIHTKYVMVVHPNIFNGYPYIYFDI